MEIGNTKSEEKKKELMNERKTETEKIRRQKKKIYIKENTKHQTYYRAFLLHTCVVYLLFILIVWVGLYVLHGVHVFSKGYLSHGI